MNPERMQKWSRSTLVKFLEREYTFGLNNILHNPDFDKEEKNKRINNMLSTFLDIYNPVRYTEMSFKKVK